MGLRNSDATRFEQLILPHLDAAYDVARWLTQNDSAAQDVVQESCLRAFQSLQRFAGDSARAWLLTIVRNQSYTWLKRSAGARYVQLDDDTTMSEEDKAAMSHSDTPEAWVRRTQDVQRLEQALNELPAHFREVIVLKDLEDMSYKDIALVIGAPIGTVMSRLARGRELLRRRLAATDE